MATKVAIWDTGATRSVISQKVVDACGLEAIGVQKVYHAQGEASDVEAFLVNIGLPNNVEFQGLRVTLGVLRSADVLIRNGYHRQRRLRRNESRW